MIFILGVAIVGHEQVVTTGESVKIAVVMEVRAQSPLHSRLATGNREAVGDGDIVDEVLERIVGLGRGVESWSSAHGGASDGFTESDIHPRGEIEAVEVGTNLLGQFPGTSTGERVGKSSDPDGRIGVDTRAVLDGLLGGFASRESSKSSIDILLLLLTLIRPRVLSFVVGLELAIRQLVKPGKHDKVNGRDLDVLLDEERLDLEKEERQLYKATMKMEEVTYPVTSLIPQPFLRELVMAGHVNKAHLTNNCVWSSRFFEFVSRVAADKTRVGALRTKSVIIVVSFELRDLMRVGVGGGGAGIAGRTGPESALILEQVALVRRSQSTLLRLSIAGVVEIGSVDPIFEILANGRAIFLGRIKKKDRDKSSRITTRRKETHEVITRIRH